MARPAPRRLARGLGAAVVSLLAATGCSPLGTFNALVPKDGGSVRLARGLAYGDGPRRRLDVYAPRGARPDAKAPVIVFFYGGSWSSGDRATYAFVGRALAAQGFVTVIPDYRLVPEVHYPGFVEDGAAAVRWVRANARSHGGDPDRILVSGHSAGAYIAAMLAVDARWLGEARRSIRGFAGLAGPYDFAPFDVEASRAAFGAWPRAEETQPVTWAGEGDPPTLLMIGGKDLTVRPRNSEALAARLRDGGVPVELKTCPDVGHVGMLTAFARPLRGRAPVLAEVARFARAATQ